MHDRIESYMQALLKSIQNELIKHCIKKEELETLFIGGGTPSVVPAKLYAPIFELLQPYLKHNAEITSEVNPNSANKEWLQGMHNLGVNRLSFGVQSFNNKKLQQLNRAHSAQEAIEAVKNAYSIGFDNISIDIIYDFQGDSKELLQSDLELALSLPINHISSYELTIEKATNFSKRVEVKSNNENLGFFLRDFITKHGLKQYEVSNYGNNPSRHNMGYWQYKEYLGLGAGAVGSIGSKRYYPHTNIDQFIKDPNYTRIEQLRQEDILTEKIFLGLRSIVGIKREVLPLSWQKNADFLCQEKKLTLQNGSYHNNELFLSDELALYIMQN